VNFHAISNAYAAIESHSRVNPAILADPGTSSYNRMRPDLRSSSNVGVFPDDGVRTDARAGRDSR
jgi:hypothetical protein